jgi:hypothetical protein
MRKNDFFVLSTDMGNTVACYLGVREVLNS